MTRSLVGRLDWPEELYNGEAASDQEVRRKRARDAHQQQVLAVFRVERELGGVVPQAETTPNRSKFKPRPTNPSITRMASVNHDERQRCTCGQDECCGSLRAGIAVDAQRTNRSGGAGQDKHSDEKGGGDSKCGPVRQRSCGRSS